MKNTNEDLELLREKVRDITMQIMCNVQLRTEVAKKIGDIKSRLGMDIKDEKVERELRKMVMAHAKEIGMNSEFALRLLNILLDESEIVQGGNHSQESIQRPNHLTIFKKAKQLEASGKEIIHMEVGEPDYPPPAKVGVALSESFKMGQYHYTDTHGITELRDAIALKEGIDTSKQQVLVTPGGRFAVFSAITSLIEAGQEIIVIEPAWPAYKECADFVGARTRVLYTTISDKWLPNTQKLEEMINPSAKMIVLNYPNNPTGKLLDSKTLDKIVSIAKDHDLYLLSDEVYADYVFGEFKSITAYSYEKSILVGSFSKRYAMTGFRVGYGIANKEIISKMARIQAVGITSVAQPMQQAALAAISTDPAENVRVMRSRLEFVCRKLSEMSLRVVEPKGAMYAYPELPSGEDIPIIEHLLDNGVAIAPGSGFGNSYKRFVRISACQPEMVLEKGLDIMASVLKERS